VKEIFWLRRYSFVACASPFSFAPCSTLLAVQLCRTITFWTLCALHGTSGSSNLDLLPTSSPPLPTLSRAVCYPFQAVSLAPSLPALQASTLGRCGGHSSEPFPGWTSLAAGEGIAGRKRMFEKNHWKNLSFHYRLQCLYRMIWKAFS